MPSEIVSYSIFTAAIAAQSLVIFSQRSSWKRRLRDLVLENEALKSSNRDQSERISSASMQIGELTGTMLAKRGNLDASFERMRNELDTTDQNVRASASLSQNSVRQMQILRESIIEIQKSFQNVHSAVVEMNNSFLFISRNLEGILGIMEKITQKSLVIKDIVLRTRLLSFNASVEAARAGAQGKGFSVVASEIGNLALNSQSQADEIDHLLNQGRAEIDRLINESRSALEGVEDRIQAAVAVSSSEIETGTASIEDATASAKQVDELLLDVSNSLLNQQTGIAEIDSFIKNLSDLSILIQNWQDRLRLEISTAQAGSTEK